jgi:YYY domain-containing protein
MSFWEIAGAFLRWWAGTTILALALWPLAYQCLKRLPDRGWSFARMAGILATGYFFWLGCWLRLWQNVPGAVWLCAGVLFAAGTLLALRRGEDPWGWLREHRREVLFTEGVFLVLFAALTWVRGYDAGATHTERPMDLAFLNAIMRSTYFPANDPWLAGYAISYYHFGYILTGMLAKMTGLAGSIAFSFGVTGSFSLAGLGAYGLLRNLLLLKGEPEPETASGPGPDLPVEAAPWRKPKEIPDAATEWRKPRSFWTSHYFWWPLLAPFTLLFLGNLEIGLEFLYSNHIGWSADWEPGQNNFWTDLDISDLNTPPTQAPKLIPDRGGWWWWAASRAVHDHPLGDASNGTKIEVIDEFPAFSFVIGDMHPHVMALPFLLMAVAVILEIFLRGGGAVAESSSDRRLFFGFTLLSIGSLVFLNTWDILIFGMAAIASWIGWKMSRREFHFGPFSGWKAFIARWAATGAAAIALFIPFLIGFSSQAGGVLPNVLFPTKGGQFIVMFGTLFVPLFAWLILELRSREWKPDWRNGLTLAGTGLAALLVGSLVVGFAISLNPEAMASLGSVLGGYGTMDALSIVLIKRFFDPWASLLPFGLIAIALAALFGWVRKNPSPLVEAGAEAEEEVIPGGKKWVDAFVLILVLWGACLALFPEYFYLRDFFGGRMNTVFKFYFQAWAFLSIAAAYGTKRLLEEIRARPAAGRSHKTYATAAFAVVLAALFIGSLYYPMAVWTKTHESNYPDEPTLDASAYLQWSHPADAAAIKWIRENITDDGPLVEAVGNDYDEYAGRVSTHTGIPGLLGWIGHEDQWRGTRAIHGPRITDIEELYKTMDWQAAEEILNKYGVRYVYYGPLEADKYGARGLGKFRAHLKVIYETEEVIIFERVVP